MKAAPAVEVATETPPAAGFSQRLAVGVGGLAAGGVMTVLGLAALTGSAASYAAIWSLGSSSSVTESSLQYRVPYYGMYALSALAVGGFVVATAAVVVGAAALIWGLV